MSVLADLANTPEAWSARAEQETTSWAASGQTEDGQRERHEAVLAAVAPRAGDRLLDFGCGTGAFAELLPPDVKYLGCDWAAGMVARARREHPSRAFAVAPPATRFDLVVCIGPFNLPDGWSKQRTFHTIRHLWDTTGCRTLAASLYSGRDENCLIYTGGELDDLGRQLTYDSSVTRIRHNDLLLVAHRSPRP